MDELKRFRSLKLSGDEMRDKGDSMAAATAYQLDLAAAKDRPEKAVVALHRHAQTLLDDHKPKPALKLLSQANQRLNAAFGPDHVYQIDLYRSAMLVYTNLGQRDKAFSAYRAAAGLIARYADVWRKVAGGDQRHRNSDAVLPPNAGLMSLTRTAALDIDGTDVAADYQAEGLRLTVYFTRIPKDISLDKLFDATKPVMMRQYDRMADTKVISEGAIKADANKSPKKGRAFVIAFTSPGGGRQRSALYLFRVAPWSVKFRYTYSENLADEATAALRVLWRAMTWPTK